jgi:glycosyltransferase involved in cell wall biosynthesis
MDAPRSKKLLFVAPSNSSFVRQDAEMLAEHFQVARFAFGSRKGLQMALYQIKLFFWLLRHLWGARVVFIWFADYHSFLPTLLARLLRRKSVLVIGGYDAARLPEYNYGGHNKPLRSWMIRKSCDWASKVLPVSAFVAEALTDRIGSGWQGKDTVVYNGIDIRLFEAAPETQARQGAICVSLADSHSRVMIKGLDRLVEVARRLPQETFTVVGLAGVAKAFLEDQHLPNLVVLPPLPRAELCSLYHSAKLVCQFSRFESFGMALGEGMLSGCIPVTVAGTGTQEIVTPETGFVATTPDIDALVRVTQQAFAQDTDMGKRARTRVLAYFSLEQRLEKLLAILNGL